MSSSPMAAPEGTSKAHSARTPLEATLDVRPAPETTTESNSSSTGTPVLKSSRSVEDASKASIASPSLEATPSASPSPEMIIESKNGSISSKSDQTLTQRLNRTYADLGHMDTIVLDPHFDRMLVVGEKHASGPKVFKINSGSLRLASRPFRVMFNGEYAESMQDIVTLPDDSSNAFLIILRIMHYMEDKLPKTLTKSELIDLAELSHKYDISGIVINFVRTKWLGTHKGDEKYWPATTVCQDWALATRRFQLKEDSDYLYSVLAMNYLVETPDSLHIQGLTRSSREEPSETSEESLETDEEPSKTCEEPLETSEEPLDTSEEPLETSEEPSETSEESFEQPSEYYLNLQDDRIVHLHEDLPDIMREYLQKTRLAALKAIRDTCQIALDDAILDGGCRTNDSAACGATRLGIIVKGLDRALLWPIPDNTAFMHMSVCFYWEKLKSMGDKYRDYSLDSSGRGVACRYTQCFGDFGLLNSVRDTLKKHAHKSLWEQWESSGYTTI